MATRRKSGRTLVAAPTQDKPGTPAAPSPREAVNQPSLPPVFPPPKEPFARGGLRRPRVMGES